MAVIIFATHVNAYDFSEVNQDGVTIYYNILSEDDKTCEVTWMEEGKDLNSHGNFTDYVGEVDTLSSANGYTVTRIGDYTTTEAAEKYGMTKSNICVIVKTNKFMKVKVGVQNLIVMNMYRYLQLVKFFFLF